MTVSDLRKIAEECGADFLAVAPADRWQELPPEKNPRSILPDCQSVIVIGRRIARGAFRGVEEGTNFNSTYRMFGKNWLEDKFLLRMANEIVCAVEKQGYDAVPLDDAIVPGRQSDMTGHGFAGNVAMECTYFAHLAGLGSMGKGGFFLTPEFGSRQRFKMILTDLVLDADLPVIDLDFCDNCSACLDACPLHAMSEELTEQGKFTRNNRLCLECKNGTCGDTYSREEKLDRLAAGCGRACLVALENKIANQFHQPFRKRAVWERDLYGKVSLRKDGDA